MLTGPYNISQVSSVVKATSSGVYILSKDGKSAAYVGRSDTDLAARIPQSAGEGRGYAAFWFEYTSSAQGAYAKECEYFHKYNPPDNGVHPAVPQGTSWRCPAVGCNR